MKKVEAKNNFKKPRRFILLLLEKHKSFILSNVRFQYKAAIQKP